MTAPIHPQKPTSCSAHQSASFWKVAHRHRLTSEGVMQGSAEGFGAFHNQPRVAKPPVSQMYTYKKLIELIVRYLMKEGFTFIEAYEQVLAIGRLNPTTTVNQLRLTNPTMDPEAFLEFKAYNAVTRLKRRYAKVIAMLNTELDLPLNPVTRPI